MNIPPLNPTQASYVLMLNKNHNKEVKTIRDYLIISVLCNIVLAIVTIVLVIILLVKG